MSTVININTSQSPYTYDELMGLIENRTQQYEGALKGQEGSIPNEVKARMYNRTKAYEGVLKEQEGSIPKEEKEKEPEAQGIRYTYDELKGLMDNRTAAYEGALKKQEGSLPGISELYASDELKGLMNNRTEAYKGALQVNSLENPVDSFSDRLRADSGLNENNVVLCTNRGVLIEFIDAKIDVTKQNMDFVATTVVNRAGKVKERIQADDYTVVIKGTLIGERGRFPYQKLVLLNQILNEARNINAASVYLYAFGITKLAFQTANFKQSALTHFNAMPFELTFKSDRDYSFLLSDY